ncbi:phosphate ABC transporter phosphate-binding protein, partial [Bacillus sp. JJ1521]
MEFKKVIKFFIVSIVLLILGACGGGNNNGTSGGLDGSVVIDGSGTVFPLMSKLAEDYMTNEQENVSVEVSRAGTSAGFKKFLVEGGGTDFN